MAPGLLCLDVERLCTSLRTATLQGRSYLLKAALREGLPFRSNSKACLFQRGLRQSAHPQLRSMNLQRASLNSIVDPI